MWFIHLFFGLVMAFNGRRAVWALVGIAGFLSGLWLATTIWWDQDNTVLTLIEGIVAILAGLVGAALFQVFGRFAVAAAGFVAGGYGLTALTQAGVVGSEPAWLYFVIGGIIGVVLIGLVFDWALIGLTAWIGAGLVISGLSLQGTSAWLVFGLVFLLGGLSQLRGGAPEERQERKKKEENE